MRFVLAIALLAGCTMYAPFHPATVSAPPDPLAKASRVLIEQGSSVDTKDDAAGVLVTKWDENTTMGTIHRLRWKVTVSGGSLLVDSQCQQKITDPAPGQNNDWSDCGAQPNDRSNKAAAIAAEIAKL